MSGFTKKEVVRDYALKFPKLPSLALARLIYKRERHLFPNLEAVRSHVRWLRGARRSGTPPIADPAPNPGRLNPFEKIPVALAHFEDWKCHHLSGPMRIMILGDLHIPYHDRPAVLSALEHAAVFQPSHIILNGDIADFFSISFWEKDPRKRRFKEEIEAVRQFLRVVREAFPEAVILYKEGNHEERWIRYLRVKAPEILDLDEVQFERIMELPALRIGLVSDKRPIKIGKLHIIHGHEFRWGITSPVNPARGFYLRGKECALGGHLHQSSSHSEKSMAETVVSCWSTGCLCNMHPDYAPINKWNHGFATVVVDKGGAFEVENYKLIKGRVFRD